MVAQGLVLEAPPAASESGGRHRLRRRCVECADIEPSTVEIVEPSAATSISPPPAVIIGSIAVVIPSESRGPVPARRSWGCPGPHGDGARRRRRRGSARRRSLPPRPQPGRIRDVANPHADDRLGDARGERVLRDVEQPLDSSGISPTPNVQALSAMYPSSVTPTSMVTRSPSPTAGARDPVDDDIVRRRCRSPSDSPCRPADVGMPSCSRMNVSAITSSSSVVIPGPRGAADVAMVSATSAPAAAIRSISREALADDHGPGGPTARESSSSMAAATSSTGRAPFTAASVPFSR